MGFGVFSIPLDGMHKGIGVCKHHVRHNEEINKNRRTSVTLFARYCSAIEKRTKKSSTHSVGRSITENVHIAHLTCSA